MTRRDAWHLAWGLARRRFPWLDGSDTRRLADLVARYASPLDALGRFARGEGIEEDRTVEDRTVSETRKCDRCGVAGVVCANDDGEILTADGHLELHPVLAAQELSCDTDTDHWLAILVAGAADGSDLHHTYCESCAEEVVRS